MALNGNGGWLEVIERAFGCSADLACTIAQVGQHRHYPARMTVINAGDVSNAIHIVLTGRAQGLALGLDGRQILVQRYQVGDVFGETGVLIQQSQSHDIVAILPLDTGRYDAVTFITLMERHQCVAMTVSKMLTRQLAETAQRMIEGATLSAHGRVYAELLRQGRQADNWVIAPAPPITDLAMLAQTTRETASRAVSQIEKRGIIVRDNHQLTIIAPHRLEEQVL